MQSVASIKPINILIVSKDMKLAIVQIERHASVRRMDTVTVTVIPRTRAISAELVPLLVLVTPQSLSLNRTPVRTFRRVPGRASGRPSLTGLDQLSGLFGDAAGVGLTLATSVMVHVVLRGHHDRFARVIVATLVLH